jgi:Na+-transporting methylmalonyl-CoA/oxaloacetate decarboxylase gamma subunit
MVINVTDLQYALLITVIGMSLVFVALLILWGLMEATVKATAWYNRSHPEEEAGANEEEEELAVELPAPAATSLKQQAAAAAVAVALALAEEEAPFYEAPQPAGYLSQPSAWQAVMRSAQLNQRSNQFTRKPRGSVR